MFTIDHGILTCFESLDDPRPEGGNKRHSLIDIVFITLCATVAGCQAWTEVEQFARRREDWFRKYLRLASGIPSHDTIGRVLSSLDTNIFHACLLDWINSLCLDLRGKGVHIDGKTLRRSFDSATNRKALHMVSAWSSDLKICLGQLATDEKSNEITAVPALIELLEIEGAVVTVDAMNCQRKTLAKVRDKKADYVATVKSNQKSLYRQISDKFVEYADEDFQSPRCRSHRQKCTTRGRDEERIVTVAPAPRAIKESGRWPGIQTIGMVYRHREKSSKSTAQQSIPETDHVTFFISSLPPKAKKIAEHVRSHWTVENSLHWSLDVTFSEDQSRIRKGSGPEVMASLRRLALSIIKRDTSLPKLSQNMKRKVAGWDTDALEGIIFGS